MNNELMGEVILQLLMNVDYDEYLQSENWAITRRNALLRAHNRCQVCNSPDSLHVHHRTYERLGMERDWDLTVLCSVCHNLFHENGRMPIPESKKAKSS